MNALRSMYLNRYPLILFLSLSAYWILPGHYEPLAFAASRVGAATVLVVSLLWLVCFAFPWQKSHLGGAPLLVALASAMVLLIPAVSHQEAYGLRAKYYDGADFSGDFGRSLPERNLAYTRVEPAINFGAGGFSFFRQYFSLPFLNDTNRRKWKPGIDPSTHNYPFSVKLDGYVEIPNGISAVRLVVHGGSGSFSLGGKSVAAGKVFSVSPGVHKLTVEYSRNQRSRPGLELLWGRVKADTPIPASYFSQFPVTGNSHVKWLGTGALLAWLAAVCIAGYRAGPRPQLNPRVYSWLAFFVVMLYYVVDLYKDGKEFGFQIFRVGNDWLTYEGFARSIVGGDWFPGREQGGLVFFNLGYRYLLAAMHWLSGEAVANVIFLQHALMAALIAFVVLAVHKRYGSRVAVAMFLILAASKDFLDFSAVLLDTTYGIILSFAILYCVLRYCDELRRGWIIGASVLLGMVLLVRANFLPFVLLIPLSLYFILPRQKRGLLKVDAPVLIAVSMVIFSLLGVRNYLVTGDWAFMPSSGMPNLWIGNHPPEFSGPTYFTVRQVPSGEVLPRIANYLVSDPLAFGRQVLDKILYIFGVDRENRVHFGVTVPWLIAIAGSFGLWRNRGVRVDLYWMWLWIIVINAPLVVIFPWGYGWRLSGPSFIPLYLLCALAISKWIGVLKSSSARSV